MSLDQYSQTPASNDLTNYFKTGMLPSAVKNAGWDIMADMAVVVGPGSVPTSGGTANAQTITNTRQYGAWFTGMWVVWNPSATNTGTMTIQPDGLTAQQVNANGAAALAGQVVSGVIAIGRYDGTNVQLINPQRSTGSFTLTFSTTYLTLQQTGTIRYAINKDSMTVFVRNTSLIQGTSASTTLVGTGAPALIAPATSTSGAHRPIYLGTDNSAAFINTVDVGTSGSWTFFGNSTLTNGAWTGSGTKGIRVFETSYTLD